MQPRWLPVAGAAGALFLGVTGYELGRAGAGGDPAIPKAQPAAAAQPSFDDQQLPDEEDPGASTTRPS